MHKFRKYSENLSGYLQKKYSIVSAGVFLAVMLIAMPAMGGLGFTNLIGQEENPPVTEEQLVPPVEENMTQPDQGMEEDMTEPFDFNEEDFTEFLEEDFNDEPQDNDNPEFVNEEGQPESECDGWMDSYGNCQPPEVCGYWEDDVEYLYNCDEGDPREENFEEENLEPEFNEEENQPEERQEKVCGNDGMEYDTPESAEAAGIDDYYYGECNKPDARELRDMKRTLDEKFNVDDLLKREKRALKRIEKRLERVNAYKEKAAKRGINGNFVAYLETIESKLEALKAEIESNLAKAEELQSLAVTFTSSMKDRYEKVQSGERGSQYFWNATCRRDFFWIKNDTLHKKADWNDNQEYIDFLYESIKQRFDAAREGLYEQIKWTDQDVEIGNFEEHTNRLKEYDSKLDELGEQALEYIKNENVDNESCNEVREDLWESMRDYQDEMNSIWEDWGTFHEDGGPWQRGFDSIWEQLNWARESGQALKELEGMMEEINGAKAALEILREKLDEQTAVKAAQELLSLIESKIIPAVEKVKEKAIEKHNPEIIWKFFDQVMDPLRRHAERKIAYTCDVYRSEDNMDLSDEERETVETFCEFSREPDQVVDLDIDFEDEELKTHVAGKLGKEGVEKIIQQVTKYIATQMLEEFAEKDQDFNTGLDTLMQMTTSVSEENEEKFAEYLREKQELIAKIAELKEETKNLKQQMKAQKTKIDSLLENVASYNLYGVKFEMNIDPETATDQEIGALEKEFENAKTQSIEKKFEDGFIPFRDVDDNTWFKGYVQEVKTDGIVNGYKDAQGKLTGEYGPGDSVTVAEFTKMILEATDKGTCSESPANAQGHWAEGYFCRAQQLGLETAGYPNLNEPVSRGAVAQTIMQVLGLEGEYDGSYPDVTASYPFAKAIGALKSANIMTGDSSGTFRPKAGINRAEVAKVIQLAKEYNTASTFSEKFDTKAFEREIESFETLEQSLQSDKGSEVNENVEENFDEGSEEDFDEGMEENLDEDIEEDFDEDIETEEVGLLTKIFQFFGNGFSKYVKTSLF